VKVPHGGQNCHTSAQVQQPGSLQTAVSKLNISLDDEDSDKTPTEAENRVSVPPSEASTETRCEDGEYIPGLDREGSRPHLNSQKRKRETSRDEDQDEDMPPQKVHKRGKGKGVRHNEIFLTAY
jgi:hypothetical protein